MSYILEALKKSQQERELGQVPTLDATGLFVEDKEPARPNYWVFLAVGLAALAVVIALYAALRGTSRQPAAPAQSASIEQARPTAPPAAALSAPRARPLPAVSAEPAPPPLVEAPPPKRPPLSPAYGSVEPDYPPIPPVPASGAGSAASGDLDPGLEEDLLRQLQAEQDAWSAARSDGSSDVGSLAPGPSTRSPTVPPDLVRDIEAFKQQLRREQGLPPPKSERKPAKITGDPTRLHLTAAQQAMVPAYLMTAHVYDADPDKRFVVINSMKYREGEETREGLRVERILKEGAVLSYLGNPFYVAR